MPKAVPALVAALILVGCGQEPEGQVTSEEARIALESEMVSLRVRRMERPDRLPVGGASGTNLGGERIMDKVGWESEQAGDRVAKILKALLAGKEIALAEPLRSTLLLPADLQKVGTLGGGLAVWGGTGDVNWGGREQFAQNRTALIREFGVRRKAKVIGIQLIPNGVVALALVELAGERKEAEATWRCRWVRGAGDALILAELESLAYEEVRSEGEASFVDATASVLGATPHFATQVGRGIADWGREITRFGDLALTGHHGIAVGDIDGDGREDLFVPDAGSLPNRLYRQLADGTVEDVSAAAGVDWYEDSRAALLVDLDNDGDQDLVLGTIAMIAVAENDGRGKFTLRGGFPGAQHPFSMCAADYDLDGDLDLYTCVYGEGDQATGGRGFDARSPVPYEDAQNGGRNILLENLGGFGFADVTDEVGLGQNNTRWSFSAAWEDYDRDGDPDLYVANDFGRNCLYRNDGGRFVEVAGELGVEDTAAGMSAAWGDYNRDALPDLYVGNMFSSAGGRVSWQGEFAPGRSREAVAGLQRMAVGNSLFAGGDGAFSQSPPESGAAMGRWAWSSGFVDVDNDGWEDLVVANGYLTGFAGTDDW